MKINIITPCNFLGYGYVGNYIIQYLSINNKIVLWPIGEVQCEPELISILKQAIKNQDDFDKNAPCIRIFHEFSLDQFVGKGIHVGFPFFETNVLTTRAKHHISNVDNLFVASKWAKEVVLSNQILSDEQIHVVPLGVDTNIFKYHQVNNTNKCIFLNIGKIEKRKGHDVLIQAFNKAFENSDNVELWMMWDNPFLKEEQKLEWINLYKNSKLGNKIRFIPRVQSNKEVARIINMSDVGVFPFRAEAWNLEIIEFLACNKQIIATNYSGPTEFLTNKNANLLSVKSMESAIDNIWFHGSGTWAEIDIDELVDHMRTLHKRKQENGFIINNEGIKTAKEFTWVNTAKTIERHIDELT